MSNIFASTDDEFTTPAALTPAIVEFCRRVNPDREPEYIRVTNFADPSRTAWFELVAEKAAQDGGQPLTGWLIWANSKMIEAEAHVVWESPTGEHLDLAQKPDGERRVLFLPQPGLWDGSQAVRSKRQALVDTRETRAIFHRGEKWDELRERFWAEGTVRLPNEVPQMLDQFAYTIVRGVPVNSPCPCGSGKKFKKCCGAPSGTPLSNL